MTRDEIFQIIKNKAMQVLPDLRPDEITMERRLKDLGANSIDRMEILTMTIEELGLKGPLVELGRVDNLRGLVDVLHERTVANPPP